MTKLTEWNQKNQGTVPPSELTLAQKKEIQQRYWEGETLAVLALEYGSKVSTLRNWIQPRAHRQ